jgi:hypothetical protein
VQWVVTYDFLEKFEGSWGGSADKAT